MTWTRPELARMIAAQSHRGPDDHGWYVSPRGVAGLGHNRLKIIDLSAAGRQPMSDPDGRLTVSFNGEIYNYVELRRALEPEYAFRSHSDTEVILAAYRKWGAACLDRFIGMFAFAIWNEAEQTLFAARDRFGVKPLVYHHRPDGTLLVASEVKALHAAGVPPVADPIAWSTYLARGWSDYGERTFWAGVRALPAGHSLSWTDGTLTTSRWYSLPAAIGPEHDARPSEVVAEEYIALLHDSIRLRLRSDAPVAVNLSGGVDSSALLALIDAQQSGARSMRAFTFITRDRRYDELPWVEQMLAGTRHRSVVCALNAGEVPDLAAAMQASQDEPFGGVPTMAYDRLFARARAEHVTVLLDGQGLDEQWAGYDYYAAAASGSAIVQGATDAPVRPDCLAPSFARLADVLQPVPRIGDPLQRLQMRDVLCTKIPRALRYNDRAAMRHSIELREPFLDHRLVELAIRQPADRKISGGVTKVLLRQMLRRITPDSVVTAPKRPVQTPQREWLREPLRDWANDCVAAMLLRRSEWLDAAAVTSVWQAYTRGESDNSFYVWQWISLALCEQVARDRQAGSTFPTDLETTMAGELCESV